MRQACLKCIDCCFEICARNVLFNIICQTLDWGEFSNISKLRDVCDGQHNVAALTPVVVDGGQWIIFFVLV